MIAAPRQSRTRAWVSCLALLAAGTSNACASFPRTHAEGGQAWLRVETAHVSVVTDQDLDEAKAAAAQLDLWWEAISKAIPIALPDASLEKLTVLALRSQGEVEAVHPEVKGALIQFPRVSLLYAGSPDNAAGANVTRHELAHAVIGARLHGIPRWLNEGLAKYLETADFDPVAGVVTWGALNESEVREAAFWRRPTVDAIVGNAPWPPADYSLLTFRAGILVHMLVNRHPGELDCFVAPPSH